jgi:hypothetical protein
MQVLLSMNHPNIVKLLGHEIERQPFWYITPYGESLWSYWKDYRAKNKADLWFDRSYQIICDILDGLAACHSHGLVHRDIKPQNIIIQDNGSAIIIDFGIVYIPEAERITTQWAGNRLMKYPPALYKTSAVAAEWDCLSIATIWGWMLAADEDLAYGHYHWKLHRFINDGRCEIVRTVMAYCSQFGTLAPKDGASMRQFIDTDLGLAKMISRSEEEKFSEALKTMLDTKVQRMLRAADFSEHFDVIAQRLGPEIEDISNSAKQLCTKLSEKGFPIFYQRSNRSFRDTIDDAMRIYAKVPHHGPILFQLLIGDDLIDKRALRFGISFGVREVKKEFKIWFAVTNPNGHSCQKWIVLYTVREDGSLEAHANSPHFSSENVFRALENLMADATFWGNKKENH